MKISIISFDLGINSLARAYLLGKVLGRHYDVEILGFTSSRTGHTIWPPCDTGEVQYTSVAGRDFPYFVKSAAEMARNIKGDVIYASKLRLPSFGVALLKKWRSKKPIVLDIDDLELSWFEHLGRMQRWRNILNPAGPVWTRWIERQTRFADEITTVSTQLQQRYGRGVIVPHGKDTDFFDPARYDRKKIRQELNIDRFKIIMFLGTVRPHKGLEDIVLSLNRLAADNVRLMVIGAGNDPVHENHLEELGNDPVLLKGQVPFSEVPRYLHAADLVVLPQRNSPQSHCQVPAKLFDAMAMAKPIIATDVGDLSTILNGCGIIVEPENLAALTCQIDWVLTHPVEAEAMGRRAREKCIKEYSWDAMEQQLLGVFEKFA